jgi:hypothetical protein
MHPLDHVMVLVEDLDRAARRYESTYGLAAVDGGRHAGLGTANAVVPLGDEYIELIAVVDTDEAGTNPVGRFLSHRLASVGEGAVAVCLRTADPTAVTARTGSAPVAMSRVRPDGVLLSWELLGMEGALGHGLPFFITWPLDEHHPARTPVAHPAGATGIAWVELGGDADRVRSWMGGDEPQLRLVGGAQGVQRFAVTMPSGEVTIT